MDTETKFTAESLRQFSGIEGKPAYAAYKGRVVDVSASRLWKNGSHMNRHKAGGDLSDEMQDAPHGPEMLDRFPQAGVLEGTGTTELEPAGVPPALERFLDRHPFFRRHPHPSLVHFPIVFMFSASLFLLFYVLTKNPGFELTTYYLLWAGLLSWLPAVLTGVYAWWINYMLRPLKLVLIKIFLSGVLVVFGMVALILRIMYPHLLEQPAAGFGPAYIVLVFLLAPLVSIIGYCGGLLTFPLKKREQDKRQEP